MSTAIPTPPNTIIAALLDIASAAFAVMHSSRKDTLDGKPIGIVDDQDALDTLHERLWHLDRLPQPEVDGHLTGPARARHYLQSFLEGVNMKTIPVSALTGAADVQRDGIQFEFEPQEWKAPAETPPDRERRLRERMIEPATPVVGKAALVEATRPLFVKAMQAEGYRTDLDKSAPDYNVVALRWEGWRAAVEQMGFKVAPSYKLNIDYTAKIGDAGERYHSQFKFAHPLPVQWRWSELWQVMNEAAAEGEDIGCLREAKTAMEAVSDVLDAFAPGWRALSTRGYTSAAMAIEQLATTCKNEIRTNMLADTADEALRIINDAGLLKNLAWMLTTRDPGTTVKIYQSSRENAATPWCLNVHEEGQVARHYRSTSLHQLIAVAHKGEQDHEYPEPD